MLDKQLFKALNSLYGRHEGLQTHQFFAPGRVCLLGEHIDYNGGEVLTAAISKGVKVIYRPTFNKVLCLASEQQEKELIINLEDEITYNPTRDWANYVLGVYKEFAKKGEKLKGAEIYFDSDLPIGSGLSSSAALMVLSAFMFDQMHQTNLSKLEIAEVCQAVENNFIGLKSGLMDSASIALAKENQILNIDCHSKEITHIPFHTSDYCLLIFDTNKPRKLSESAYNERTEACVKALSQIEAVKDKKLFWRDLSCNDAKVLKEKNLLKRATHVLGEMQRVREAKRFLDKMDYDSFGKLMYASHASLRDNYEVSCPELDLFVELAAKNENCLGAKMTGAGFGGSAVALVRKNNLTEFTKEIEHRYYAETGLSGKASVSEIASGVRVL